MFSYTKLMQAMVAAGVVSATDPYFNLVTLLLPGNGTNGAQNNTFLDSSSNNFTITRNGNTTQGTFSPFSQTGWSNYFDGTGDYLTGTITAVNNTTMTMECWVWLNEFDNVNGDHLLQVNNGANINYGLIHNGNGAVRFLSRNNTGGAIFDIISANSILQTNKWHHIVGVRNASAASLYVDGTRVATVSSPTVSSTDGTSFQIAYNAAVSPREPNAYISNVRIVSGTAVYDPTSSSLTVPTSPLTAVSGTRILTCQSNRFVDNSGNNVALTVNGTPSVQAFSPFAPTAAYSATDVGGSGYFDGSGDYVTAPSNAAFSLGTGDFTIEAFVYLPTAGSAGYGIVSINGYELYVRNSAGGTTVSWYDGSTVLASSASAVVSNTWNHVAISRTGTTLRIYLNGTSGTSVTNSQSVGGTSVCYVGSYSNGTSDLYSGYISNVRIIKGQAIYTGASITVPNAPLTTTGYGSTSQSITGTISLLLNFTNAGITDATAKNIFETVGNASISTAQSKFGGGSMYFDGTGDYLSATPKIQSNAMQGGNATIEMWVYSSNSSSSLKCLIDTRSGQGTDTGYGIYQIANNVVIYGNGVKGNAAGQLAGNTWTHLAVTRANTTNYVFIGGTLYNTFTYGNTLTSSNVTIGSDVAASNAFTGYIDDLRITNGYARYTANFTPTTVTFPLQ